MKLITPPVSMPVTLSEAKAQLRLKTAFTADDNYITVLINVATAYAESYCNRRLITQTREKSFEKWTDIESVFFGQLQEVVQITWLDEDKASDTLSADDYIVTGIGTDEGRVEFVDDVDLSTDLYQVDPIQVRYTIGYYQGEAWAAETAQSVGDKVLADYGLVAQCTVEGTTDASAPTWPATIGETVEDGTATWTIIGRAVPDMIKQAILILITYYYENREPAKGTEIDTVDALLLPYRIWDFAE
jgi:uncharacterized phiE125 gp8 family phage protein